MKWIKIDHENPPSGEVLATDMAGTFVIGQIIVKNYGFAGYSVYCKSRFYDPDDYSYYKEMVTHYVRMEDLNKELSK